MNLILRSGFVIASALLIPAAANAAGVELIVTDRAKYEEATNLIQTWSGQGDELDRAFKILSGVAERNPRSAHAIAAYAELKYRLLGVYQGSAGVVLDMAGRAVKLDPENADAQVIYSKILLRQQEVDMAARAAERAIQLAPDKPEAMSQMASVAREATRYDEAETWYRRAIQRFAQRQRKANTYYHLADMLSKRTPVDAAKTAAAYGNAVDLDAGSFQIPYDAAIFLMDYTEQYDRAIGYMTKARSVSDSDEARQNFGLLQFYRWGHATLHPEKYRDAKDKPWDPEKITAVTGVRKEDAFAVNPIVEGAPYATLALLKLKMVTDIDAFPKHCECRPDNALIAAAHANHLDMVRTLVVAGANVNAANPKHGNTALLYAVRFQNLEMVRFLVEHGARINLQDKRGTLLVEYAIVDAKADDARVLELLLDKGGDADAVTRTGSPLVAIAVMQGKPAALALLLGTYKADPNARLSGEHGDPILTLAARSAHADSVKMIKLLLEAGANPWVKAGGMDVVSSLINSKEAFAPPADAQPQFKAAAQAMTRSTDAILAMLTDARRKIPKPAGF